MRDYAKEYRAQRRRARWSAVRATLPGRMETVVGWHVGNDITVNMRRVWNVRWLKLAEALRLCVELPAAYQESRWLKTRLWCLPWHHEQTMGVARIVANGSNVIRG